MYGSSEEIDSEDSDVGTPREANRSVGSNGNEAAIMAAKPNVEMHRPQLTASVSAMKLHKNASDSDDVATVNIPTARPTASGSGLKLHTNANDSGDVATSNTPTVPTMTTEAIVPSLGIQDPVEVSLSNGKRNNPNQKGKAIVHCATSPMANEKSWTKGSCSSDIATNHPARISDIRANRQVSFHENGYSDDIGNRIPDEAEELVSENGKIGRHEQHETMSQISNANGSRDHVGVLEGDRGFPIYTPHDPYATHKFSPTSTKLQVYLQRRSFKKKRNLGLIHGPALHAESDTQSITPMLFPQMDETLSTCGPVQHEKPIIWRMEKHNLSMKRQHFFTPRSKRQQICGRW